MTFSSQRSDAIRDGLITEVDRGTRRHQLIRRLLAGAALVTAGLLVGGAVSAFALANRTPTGSTEGAATPEWVPPGAPIISLLGDPVTQRVDGTTEIPLPPVPNGATHVRLTVTCLTVGLTSWGLDPVSNPSIGCGVNDMDGTHDNSGWFDFELSTGDPTIYIGANAGVQSIVTYEFLNYVPTAWGVNPNGQSYGVQKPNGMTPDLMAVVGVDSEGNRITGEGYAYSSDLDAFGPDWPNQPTSPDQAIAWQEARDAKYPNGWDIPVYASDGTTQVGTFHIGS